jgi:hypothetical protein
MVLELSYDLIAFSPPLRPLSWKIFARDEKEGDNGALIP